MAKSPLRSLTQDELQGMAGGISDKNGLNRIAGETLSDILRVQLRRRPGFLPW